MTLEISKREEKGEEKETSLLSVSPCFKQSGGRICTDIRSTRLDESISRHNPNQTCSKRLDPSVVQGPQDKAKRPKTALISEPSPVGVLRQQASAVFCLSRVWCPHLSFPLSSAVPSSGIPSAPPTQLHLLPSKPSLSFPLSGVAARGRHFASFIAAIRQ